MVPVAGEGGVPKSSTSIRHVPGRFCATLLRKVNDGTAFSDILTSTTQLVRKRTIFCSGTTACPTRPVVARTRPFGAVLPSLHMQKQTRTAATVFSKEAHEMSVGTNAVPCYVRGSAPCQAWQQTYPHFSFVRPPNLSCPLRHFGGSTCRRAKCIYGCARCACKCMRHQFFLTKVTEQRQTSLTMPRCADAK